MSRIVPLIAFGIGLIGFGVTWTLYDEVRTYFEPYIIDNAAYQLQFFMFRMMPIIVLFIGIMCLIAAGTLTRRSHKEEY